MRRLTRTDLEVTIGELIFHLELDENHTLILEGHNPGDGKLYEMQLLRKEKDEHSGITHYYLEKIFSPGGAANIKEFYAYLRGMIDVAGLLKFGKNTVTMKNP